MKYLFILFLFACPATAFAQDARARMEEVNHQLEVLRQQQHELEAQLEELKLLRIREDLVKAGFPTADTLSHSAYYFAYAEEHEQARWVVHMITPDVKDLGVGRTNDFREDPKVGTGTAQEVDYFVKTLLPDSSYAYDGYGYDRGHLAPSADFRWSEKALSESYFYSNMSPQVPELNREVWADLEGFLRGYVIRNEVDLYVLTAPVLRPDLPKVPRSPNGLSLPQQFVKVAVDPKNGRGIAFILDNVPTLKSYTDFAVTIDSVESLLGWDIFPAFSEAWESRFDGYAWYPDEKHGDVPPIPYADLPYGHFNTVSGASQAGEGRTIKVCGTVVGSRYSRSGHAWLNLDKQYPNEIFSVMIRKESLSNFDYDPVKTLSQEQLCFSGEVSKFGDKPVMVIEKPEVISDFEKKR